MRFLFTILSVVIGAIGLFFIVRGVVHPSTYQKTLSEDNPSAVQVTQIYTEATHGIVAGIGIISIAVLVGVVGILFHVSKALSSGVQSIDNLES